MTAPRTALFQRKGQPVSSNLSAGKPGVQDLESGPPPVTPPDGEEGGEMVTCPECGCQFDPDQAQEGMEGQQPPMGGDDSGGGDLGAKIAAMMQGGQPS